MQACETQYAPGRHVVTPPVDGWGGSTPLCRLCALFVPWKRSDCMLCAEYDKNGDNKWEIDDGMRALDRLPQLILMLRPYEEPRDLRRAWGGCPGSLR